jgi:hypothetical protein
MGDTELSGGSLGGQSSENKNQSTDNSGTLKQPTPEDIIKYDLQIQNYAAEEDYEPFDDNDY